MARRVAPFWVRAVTVLLLCVIAVPSHAQQPSPAPSVVIRFFVEVNNNTINQLLALVSSQIASGVKRITLLISSTGGETTSAFTAYNFLKGVPVELTTFNIGNVDSAATLLYCAGTKRYSLPGTRFVLHSASLTFAGNGSMTMDNLEGQLEMLKNQNQMLAKVIASATIKKQPEIENILRGQVLLTPEEAMEWGLVQVIKSDFMEPGATLLSINSPAQNESAPPEYRVLPKNPANPETRISGDISDVK